MLELDVPSFKIIVPEFVPLDFQISVPFMSLVAVKYKEFLKLIRCCGDEDEDSVKYL